MPVFSSFYSDSEHANMLTNYHYNTKASLTVAAKMPLLRWLQLHGELQGVGLLSTPTFN